MRFGIGQKGGLQGIINNVIGQRRAVFRRTQQGEVTGTFPFMLAAHAQRRGIDHQSRGGVMTGFPGHGFQAETFGQRQMRFVGGRRDANLPEARQREPRGHGAGRASRSQQQYRHVRRKIQSLQRGHEARHVRIVAPEFAVFPEQRIDSAYGFGFPRQAVQQRHDGDLVRDGHAQAAHGQGAHGVQKARQIVGGDFPAQIDAGQIEGLEAGVVNKRAQTLSQRPADDPVNILGHKGNGHGISPGAFSV